MLQGAERILQPPRTGSGEGILVVDKPQGMTSNQLLQRLKRAGGRKKMGYQGTLDPLATGVLPVFLGWATKAIPFVSDGPKRYRAQMILGAVTDTQDAMGNVVGTSDREPPDRDALEEVCRSFLGVQSQVPPVYSALKHQGVPLYRWARQGKPVEKPPRTITIQSIRITDVAGKAVWLEVTCSPGTYVRTLCRDIGERTGCGAYLNALVRLQSGPFTLEKAWPLEVLEKAAERGDLDAFLADLPEVLGRMPRIRLGETWKKKIQEGRPIPEPGDPSPWSLIVPGDTVCVTGSDHEELWAFYRAGDDGRRELRPLRVLI